MNHAGGETRLGSEDDGGRLFWVCAIVGLGIVAFGLYGLLNARLIGSVGSWATYLVGGLLVHDALLAPIVVAASVALIYLVPSRIRPAVQGTLIIVGTVALVAIPVVGGWGRKPGNPTLLPRDYTAGLAVAVCVIVLVGLFAAIRSARRPAPEREPERPRGW